jgi:hypothetical protein
MLFNKPATVAVLCTVSLSLFSGERAAPPQTMAAAIHTESDWDILLTLPVWAAGLSGDVGVRGFAPVAVDMQFKEIAENLDMTAALTLEARHRRWGLILDGMYLKMSDTGETPGRLLTSVDVQVEQVLAEVAVAYRLLEGDRGYLDLLAGARYMYLSTELNFHLNSAGVRSISEDLSNAAVDRAVDAIRDRLNQAAARARVELASRAQLARTELNNRVDAVRQELRERAIQKILEERLLIDIIRFIRNLTPAERDEIRQKIQQSREIIAANKELASALAQERVAAAVSAVRNEVQRRAQRAVVRAKKQLAAAIESKIREIVPEHVSGSQSWVDPFVGLRGRLNLTDKLYLAARGDIGGFGVASDLTWNAFAALGYQWTRKVSTELGYRHLAIDYSDGGFIYDAEMSGAYLGLTIRL